MTLAERVAEFERRAIIRILRKTNGNVTHAARIAGRNRTNFYTLLNRHGIRPRTRKSSALYATLIETHRSTAKPI